MSIYVYIAAMALTTYLIRVLPMTIFRRPIRSRFLKSFLYYVPYACLSAMTFPAILSSTNSIISGAAALAAAVFTAYRGKSLMTVALVSSAAVLVTEGLLAVLGWARVTGGDKLVFVAECQSFLSLRDQCAHWSWQSPS